MDEQLNYNRLETYRETAATKIKYIITIDLIALIVINMCMVITHFYVKSEPMIQLLMGFNMLNLVSVTYYITHLLNVYKKKFRQLSLPTLIDDFKEEDRHEYRPYYESTIQNTGLYNRVDQLSVKNVITGTVNGSKLTRADVKFGNITYFSNRRRRYLPICHGHWYIVDMNERIAEVTHIKQRNKNYIFKNEELPIDDESIFNELTVDNEGFTEQFQVFTTDQKESKRLLTLNVLKLINRLNAKYPGQIVVAFANRQFHIGIHHYKKRFTPPVFRTINNDTVGEQVEDLKLIKELILELTK